jgi:hypothetical protein
MSTVHIDVQAHQSDKEYRRLLARFTKGIIVDHGLSQKMSMTLDPNAEIEYPIDNGMFIFQSNYFDTDISPFDLVLISDIGEINLSSVSMFILDVKNINSVRIINTSDSMQSYHVIS